MRNSVAAARTTLLLAMLLVGGCVTKTMGGSPSAEPAVGPPMVIEAFLRAANQQDLDTMASLFGTEAGPVSKIWEPKQVDQRMLIFASLLRHTDYTVGGEQIVPGRRNSAAQYSVRLVAEQGTYQVPFTLVRSRDSHWLIEEIGIERITRGTGLR